MVIGFFIIVCSIMIWFSYIVNKRLINIISIFSIPYMIIIPINNLIMTRYGFYKITNEVILMILSGLIMIFIGGLIADFNKRVSKTKVIIDYEQNHEKFIFYRIKTIKKYVYLVAVITIIRLTLIIVQHGLLYITTADFEGILIRGVFGHLLLTIYPLIPILFYYWLNNKKEVSYLFIVMLSIVLFFLTFVKYHSIGIVLMIYLFVSIENHKYIKKGALVVITFACSLFVMNYFLSFMIRDTTSLLKDNYYLEHFWNYMAGSLIYDNRIFETGIRLNTNIFYKIGTFTLAPISQFTNVLFGIRLCPHEALPFQYVGTNGERGNVVDAIGYLYPSNVNFGEIIVWCIFLVFIGFLFTKIYTNELKKKNRFAVTLAAFMTFFMAFSFFGSFYINFTCWEILFWCFIMPKIFDRRITINVDSVRIC